LVACGGGGGGRRGARRGRKREKGGESTSDLVQDPPFVDGHSVREAEARIHDYAAALVCGRTQFTFHLARTCRRRTGIALYWCQRWIHTLSSGAPVLAGERDSCSATRTPTSTAQQYRARQDAVGVPALVVGIHHQRHWHGAKALRPPASQRCTARHRVHTAHTRGASNGPDMRRGRAAAGGGRRPAGEGREGRPGTPFPRR